MALKVGAGDTVILPRQKVSGGRGGGLLPASAIVDLLR